MAEGYVHTESDLRQMTSLPLEAKIRMTKNRIKAWYDYFDGDVYVSFSGGKDSTVLKHIVDSMYDDVPAVFVNTGLEYPEVRQFALKQDNAVRIDPKMYFYEVIEKYGYPVISKEQAQYINEAKHTNSEKLRDIRLNGNKSGRGRISKKWIPLVSAPFDVSHKCCNIMKKNPAKAYEKETGRKPIVGTMVSESALRMQRWLRFGCNAFGEKRQVSAPMSFWTEQDVLRYIVVNKLEIASVYGKVIMGKDGLLKTTGLPRTGCMFCMFGVHLEESPNRFQKMKITHPKQYDYCINKLGLKQVLDYIHVDY